MKFFARFVASCVFALVLAAGGFASQAAETVNFILNWVPGADHAPYFFAKERGWYAEAGLDVEIEPGKGSGMSSQRVGIGKNQIGIAELSTALVAKSKGANLVAVMNVYANTPFGIYWLGDSSIRGPMDFAGKKLGNPPWDAARVMWPAFEKATGLKPGSVEFVNIQPQAKVPALLSGSVEIITNFYNGHDTMRRQLGDDMGFLSWKDIGINPYGNSIIVNADYLESNRDAVAAFVRVTQKAFRTCVDDPAACLGVLMTSTSGLNLQDQEDQWGRVIELMTDEFTTTVALGYFDPGRMKSDYELVDQYFELDEPFDIGSAYTNEFLDRNIKMP